MQGVDNIFCYYIINGTEKCFFLNISRGNLTSKILIIYGPNFDGNSYPKSLKASTTFIGAGWRLPCPGRGAPIMKLSP